MNTLDPNDSVCRLDAEMAELTLLLPAWWLTVLEEQAKTDGKTAAQMVRRLIRTHLCGS